MYNKLLDTFLAVADCGSFNRAADQLHISSTAIIKQINQLEDEIGVSLFRRTQRGVALTRAGKVLQEEGRELIQLSRNALERVRQTEIRSGGQVRLGTAMLRSARFFLELWSTRYGKPLEHRVNIVPFLDNSYEAYMELVSNLGKDIDVIATTFPAELTGYQCNALEITQIPFCCAVPAGHPLAEKSMLEVGDLRGESILILERGRSSAVDAARAELEKYPDITLVDTPDYEPATFNRCHAEGLPLLSRECWKYAHPLLKTVPINWSFGGPYGLLYAKDPSPDTAAFIDYIERSLRRGQE